MSSKPRLSGKVAIITGGTSGIGEDMVRLFAENGASVVAVGTRPEEEVVASINSSDKISYCRCDVRDEKQIEEMVKFVIEKYGKVDILICSAAIVGPMTGLLKFDSEGFDNTMAVNVRGVAVTMKHVGRAMIERNIRGSIVCMASLASIGAGVSPLIYTAGKHALLGLVRGSCGELGEYGIRVNCISPTGVATPLVFDGFKVTESQLVESTEALSCLKGRAVQVRDVAEAALFLASDESASVNGHNLVVDGGTTAVIGGRTNPNWEFRFE